MAWTDRSGTTRADLMQERKEAAETPEQRVKRILIERTDGRRDIVMGVRLLPATPQDMYEMHTMRKHHSVTEDNIPLVRALASAGLERGTDFELAATRDNAFKLTVSRSAFEKAVRHRGDEPVTRDDAITRLGVGKDAIMGLKRLPTRAEPAYAITTSTVYPDDPPEATTLVAKLEEMGIRKGDFTATGDGRKGVTVTIARSTLEERIPATRMPSRTHD